MIAAALAAAVAAAALGVAAVVLLWLRRGGAVPRLRLLALVALGALTAVLIGALQRRLAGGGGGHRVLADPMAHGASLACLASVLAAAIVLATLVGAAGDRLTSPTSGAGLAVAFALGSFLAVAAVVLGTGAPLVGMVVLAAATLLGVAVPAGSLAGGSRLVAPVGGKLLMLLAAAVVAASLTAAAVVCFAAVVGTAAGWRWAVMAAVELAVAAGVGFADWRWEHRTLGVELADETALGVLPGELVPALLSPGGRTAGRWWPRADERWAVLGLSTQLGFRKHYLRQLDGDRARIYSLEVGRLRERARRLLEPDRAAEPGAELRA